VTFDPARIDSLAVRELIRGTAIPQGFIHIPEPSRLDRTWRISISGDESRKCMDLAKEAAGICAEIRPLVLETVLNFKEGSRRLDYIPDREKLQAAGLSLGESAREIRRNIHGPVAYKRVSGDLEMDVRIRGAGGEIPSLGRAREYRVSPLIKTEDLMSERIGPDISTIYREDRRRTASLTIRTRPQDPRRVKQIVLEALSGLALPEGYVVTFDPEAIEKARMLSGTLFRFILAILFCGMFIAAVNESFAMPVIALLVTAPSIAVPVLIMAALGMPFNTAGACAFVAVSGIAVNAAALIADGFAPYIRARENPGIAETGRIIHSRSSSLLATGGTTILGALPFLLLGETANAGVRVLSLVTVFGVAASCAASILLIPAQVTFLSLVSGKKNGKPHNRRHV
jgi:multidrug efflux pump subunit AcrB